MNDYVRLVEDDLANEQIARTSAVADIDASPDNAKRAIDLARTTGASPSVVYNDLDNYDRQVKAGLAGDLIANNPRLGEFVTSDPMIPKLANDDYGQLDAVSQAADGLSRRSFINDSIPSIDRPNAFNRGLVTAFIVNNPKMLGKAMEAAAQLGPEAAYEGLTQMGKDLEAWSKLPGTEYQPFQMELSKLRGLEDVPGFLGENLGNAVGSALAPMLAAIGGGLIGGNVGAGIGAFSVGYPLAVGEVYEALIDAGVNKRTAAVHAANAGAIIAALDLVAPAQMLAGMKGLKDHVIKNVVVEISKKLAKGAVTEGLTEGIQESIKLGLVSYAADDKPFFTAENAIKIVDSIASGAIGGTAFGAGGAVISHGQSISQKLDPWLRNGVEPPAFLDDDLDGLKAKQNQIDLKSLADMSSEVQKSALFARSPDLMRQFLAMHTDQKIGLSAESVQRLYGDKVPEPGDGLFGDLPNFAAQYESALRTGGDVAIPLPDWLTRVDPTVYQEVKDDIRVRPGNVTKADQEAFKIAEEGIETIPERIEPSFPTETLRDAAALEPLFQIADKKLKLKKAERAQRAAGEENFHDFEFVNQDGKALGYILASVEDGGKLIYIEDIAGSQRDDSPNMLGPRVTRDLLRQLRDQFPEATRMRGYRVSGARQQKEAYGYWEVETAKLQEMLSDEATDYPKLLREMNVWRRVDEKSMVDIPLPKELQGKERELANAITEELNRLIPKQVTHAPAVAIKHEDRHVQGLYQGFKDVKPVLFWSLASDDPRVTARHEALHHLRQQGFFTLHEWEQLREAAYDSDWKAKYNIDSRYFDLSEGQKIEEAIAEAFGEWRRSEDKLQYAGPIDVLFQRLEQLFERIRYRVKEFLGRDLTADEIFEAIERGEVGSRDGNAPLRPFAWREQKANAKLTPSELRYITETMNDLKDAVPSIELKDGRLDWDPEHSGALVQWMEDQRYYGAGRLPPSFYNTNRFMERMKGAPDEYPIKALEQRPRTPVQTLDDASLRAVIAGLPGEIPPMPTARVQLEQFTPELVAALRKAGVYADDTGTVSVTDVTRLVEEAERRAKVAARPPRAKPTGERQLDLGQDLTRMEDREPFDKPAAIGMTRDQYARYMKRIDQRHEEDVAAATEVARRDETRRQSETWKQNEVPIRAEVLEEFDKRPDVQAIAAFRYGVPHEGGTLRLRIDPDFLDPDQRKTFPEMWTLENGLNPSDIAGMFGYPDGASMIDGMTDYYLNEVASAKRPVEYRRQLIQAEVTRRMEAQYGKLADNVLDEIKDRVLSETQLDILAEEVMALAPPSAQFSISKDQMKEWARTDLMQQDLETTSSDKYLQQAGKTGKLAELALLKGDYAEAFRLKQLQFVNVVMAKEMAIVEREQTKFERTVKRFSQREVAGINQEATDYIQALLAQADIVGKRTVPEIVDAIARRGKDLGQYTDRLTAEGWQPAVSPDLIAQGPKTLDVSTVGEFLDFKTAIDSLVHIGRAQEQMDLGVEKLSFEAFKAEVLGNIRTLPPRKADSRNFFYVADAALTKQTEVIKDLDLREELGPLYRAVVAPLERAKSRELQMSRELRQRLERINVGDKKWQKSLDDTIPQNFLWDPWTENYFDLSRQHMLNIMLNFGNRSNIDKFTKGWVEGRDQMSREEIATGANHLEMQLRRMFDTHATKQDWDWVQSIWDLFEDYKTQANDLAYEMSGVPAKWIDPEPLSTPHGNYRGGYFPIIYDKFRGGLDKTGGPDSLFGSDYFRASTPHGYLAERTGYMDYVAFTNTIETVGARLQQMIHDISHRKAVMEAAKVLYDPQIKGAIKKHYGIEYADQLDPWLKDVANHFNLNEQANWFVNNVMRPMRMNLMVHALGLNLRVILSPSLGTQNPASIAWRSAYKQLNPEIKQEAMDKSRELPFTMESLDRDYREQLESQIIKQGWVSDARAKAARWAFYPMLKVEEGLRVNTWTNVYHEQLSKGRSEDDAITLADDAIRERHGSSAVVDLPQIMRNGELMKQITLFYGYFNTVYNWQRQIPGQVRRGEVKNLMGTFYGAVLIPAAFGAMFFNQQKESDSWFKTIAKALLLQPLQTVPFMREAATYLFEGHLPNSPLGSILRAMGAFGTDVVNMMNGKPVKKPISHTANVIGLTTGLPLAQIGRTAQFTSDVMQDKQRPRNIQEWIRGIINGEARLKK